jgi:hypothetical protein
MSPELFERIARDNKACSLVPRAKNLRHKIEELLAVGVSKKWIAHHLGCSSRKVEWVTKSWKRDKLPLIL